LRRTCGDAQQDGSDEQTMATATSDNKKNEDGEAQR